ncbi:TipAS antibiotic-recognition domain-containing protein [Streptomyces sp. NPDC059352]|uniref:TipAS antibiotic-recognition domain-containing protein n=1 Tax=Streptomyces sp. NPDC059352 TaxID=3346810 RepID=UPI0036CD1F75
MPTWSGIRRRSPSPSRSWPKDWPGHSYANWRASKPWARVLKAEERWGDSAQWAQYAERGAGMAPEEWKGIAAATDALNADLATAEHAAVAPGVTSRARHSRNPVEPSGPRK